MTLLNKILEWTQTLPAWQSDAARRLLQCQRVARSFIIDFGSCQNRITTLTDGSASDAHLRTDLPKNRAIVLFLKASTAYMA